MANLNHKQMETLVKVLKDAQNSAIDKQEFSLLDDLFHIEKVVEEVIPVKG